MEEKKGSQYISRAEREMARKDKTILMMSIVCAALLVLLIVMTGVLASVLTNVNNKDIGPDVSENAIIETSKELFGGDIDRTQNGSVEGPDEDGCSCPEGVPYDYIALEGKCKHEVICSGCLARRGLEPCDTADGVACIACGVVPAHDY